MRAAFEHIAGLIQQMVTVPGDFGEFGVWHGDTFMGIAEAACAAGKVAHAVDSFRGMEPPTPMDFDAQGKCLYDEGALSVGGSQAFRARVLRFGKGVEVWEGYIPIVLYRMAFLSFAFAHVDLDQYRPTRHTLTWLWPRMSPGGIVCCHDWIADRRRLASQAIREWMTCARVDPAGEKKESRHIWFRKP